MKEIDVNSVELCDYMTWAYMNAVPLQGDDAQQQIYNELATTFCPENYYNPMA